MMANHILKPCTASSIDASNEIVTILASMTKHISKLARNYNEDYEEVYQQAALYAALYPEKGSAYTYTCLRNYYGRKYSRSLNLNIVSLDMPLSNDTDDLLLADTIPYDDTHCRRKATNEQRIAELYAALPYLSCDEQEYFTRVYKLDFTPVVTPGVKQMRPNRPSHIIGQSARLHLKSLLQF